MAVHIVQGIVERLALGLFLLTQEVEVSLKLLAHEVKRVARMEDHKLGRREHLVLRLALVDDALMNLSLVAKVGTVLEDAQLEDRAREAISLILVDVDEAADHADDGLLALFHLRQHRAHPLDRLRAEILIGVEEEDPVALRLFQRAVLRSGEVVLPRMVEYARASGFRHLDRAVGRASIDDDHLVGELLHRSEPRADILFFILCDHAGRKLHAPTSFIHAS